MLGAEIVGQPRLEALFAVPVQAAQIVAERMERAFGRAQIDGMMKRLARDSRHSVALEPFLQLGNVFLGGRPWQGTIARCRIENGRKLVYQNQNGRILHLVA